MSSGCGGDVAVGGISLRGGLGVRLPAALVGLGRNLSWGLGYQW
jgi:hypothetical protein